MQDTNLDELFEDKFMTASKFSLEVEKIVQSNHGGLNYIDAVIVYCDQNDIEIDSVSKLISKTLKEKIKVDAQNMNYMKRTSYAKLPV